MNPGATTTFDVGDNDDAAASGAPINDDYDRDWTAQKDKITAERAEIATEVGKIECGLFLSTHCRVHMNTPSYGYGLQIIFNSKKRQDATLSGLYFSVHKSKDERRPTQIYNVALESIQKAIQGTSFEVNGCWIKKKIYCGRRRIGQIVGGIVLHSL